MYAMGAPPAFASGCAGFASVDRFAGISQEPRQPQADQHNSSNDRGGLLAAQIGDQSADFVEIGVAQQVGDVLEPGRDIVHVARRLRKLLLKVAGRMMGGRRETSHPHCCRNSLAPAALSSQLQRSRSFEILIRR
jgi:hypothetical protein